MKRLGWKRTGTVALAALALVASGCLYDGGVVAPTPSSGSSYLPNQGSASSDDGRFVVFSSNSADLGPVDPDFEFSDIYVRDIETGAIDRITDAIVNPSYYAWPSISDDGRYVVFTSSHPFSEYLSVWLHDRVTDTTTRVDTRWDGSDPAWSPWNSLGAMISGDGNWIVFTSGDDQIIEPLPGGVPATAKHQVYRRPRAGGPAELVSPAHDSNYANGASGSPSISDDGSRIAFDSVASNLVDDDSNGVSDVFVSTMPGASVERVSVSTGGTEANAWSRAAAISGDGQHVTFKTNSDNLVPGSLAGYRTTALRDLSAGTTSGLGPTPRDVGGFADGGPGISDDGRVVVSGARSALNPGDPADGGLYAFDRATGDVVLVSTDPRGKVLPDDNLVHVSGDGKTVQFTSVGSVRYRAAFPPEVTSVSPPSLAPDSTQTITFTGKHFDSDVDVDIKGDGITINSVTRVSETQIDVSVTIAGSASPGGRMVVVIDPGVKQATRAYAGVDIETAG